jgi:hypothetical protein
MYRYFLKLFFIAIFGFFINGCTHQELIPPDHAKDLASEQNSQDQSTVDTSDLGPVIDSSSGGIQISRPAPTPPPSQVQNNVIQRIPFPVSEYEALPKTGNATITGKLYIITPTGAKVYGKNRKLYLNPITSYSQQWYKESYLGHKKLSKADSRLYSYLRLTETNSNGEFTFNEVPAGRYYLIGVVRCKEECGFEKARNIRIAKEISVQNGETINVDLSRYVN